MKTIVVLSDTHGNVASIMNINKIMEESDYCVHLGDLSQDMNIFKSSLKEKLILINGNCDCATGVKEEIVLDIEESRVLCVHGHRYSVKKGLKTLINRAKELGCNVALYGHTHNANVENIDGVLLVNPGNMTRMSSEKSFCYLVINGKKAIATINKNNL